MSSVIDYLSERHLGYIELDHVATATPVDEAHALGLRPSEVAKTIVLDTDRGHAVAVIPATRRLDMKLVREVLGRHARLADETEISRDLPGFELGTVPPLGSLLEVPTYIDPEVAEHETVVFAAGTQTASVQMRSVDLIDDRNVRVVRLTKRSLFSEDAP